MSRLCLAALTATWSLASFAADITPFDFSLRFPAGLSRFANYGDVAGLGGASVASPWTSSVNPASLSWSEASGPFGLYNALQHSRIEFDNGSRFDVSALALVYETEQSGTWSLGYAQAGSNRKTLRSGVGLDFESALIDFGWGRRIGEKFAFGLGARWTEAEVTNHFSGMTIGIGESPSYSLKTGLLFAAVPDLLIGALYETGRSDDQTQVLDQNSGQFIALNDTTDQHFFRTGLYWNYSGESALYIDTHYGWFENSTGKLEVFRLSSGVEQKIYQGVFLRAGLLKELKWDYLSWTLGLGIYPSETLSLDLAFQKDFFPEIEEEFGGSETISLSFSLSY